MEIGIAALLFRVKPCHVEKFLKCRFADVAKSDLWKKIKKKHAQNIRSTVDRMGDLTRLAIHAFVIVDTVISERLQAVTVIHILIGFCHDKTGGE